MVRDKQIGGQYFLQEYKLAADKRRASTQTVTSPPSKTQLAPGKTLLIGTFPGGAYFRGHAPATREFFRRASGLGGHSTASPVERP